MSTAASLGSPEYRLNSDLNRECLPATHREPDRGVAWANALCAGVLAVGVLMTKEPAALVFNKQAYEPPAVLPVEEAPPAVPETVRDLVLEEVSEAPTAAASAPVVVVAAEPAAVPFAVPVVGATLASFDLRTVSAPPVLTSSGPSANPGPAVSAPPSILRYGQRGAQGDLPWPTAADYPPEARDRKEVGDVVFIAVVSEQGGLPVDVLIEKSSGSTYLDAHTRDWVRTRWKFFPGNPQRWRCMFTYQLNGVSR